MKSEVIGESDGFSRLIEIEIDGKTLMTPTYFPAISSFGIKYSFSSLISLFLVHKYPRVLISAYDWYFLSSQIREEIRKEISEYSIDSFIFLDSGVFESFWRADKRWNHKLHKAAMSTARFDFYSSYDVLPQGKSKNFLQKTIKGIVDSRNLSEKGGFFPIIHGCPDELVLATEKLTRNYPKLCNFIAISERDCGEGIIEKARTIKRIRKALDAGTKNNRSRILHILGCGDPLSMLLFTFAGANSFDSLDWIKYLIEPNRLILNTFSHLDLVNCDCAVCAGPQRPYVEIVFLHNLLFYQKYVLQIQSLIKENSLGVLLGRCFSQNVLDKTQTKRKGST
jgi:hypothetical protein